ncbi:apyrase [Daktulosphaira vitifoliae]|uniref:apyrase n=1 Tax=Daktulosphaira vitifoliae TaxID=58002 RepID=UPI0021AAF6BB|nr:apyrase [Daktulosphaira vitifoliae]
MPSGDSYINVEENVKLITVNRSNMLKELRQSLSSSQAYRISNTTIRFQTHFIIIVLLVGIIFLVTLYNIGHSAPKLVSYGFSRPTDNFLFREIKSKYPLTQPTLIDNIGIKYRIGMISDLDKASKSENEKNTWISYYKKGYFIWYSYNNTIDIKWDIEEPSILKSSLSMGGRGMELSELVTFNNKIYTFDDRTGIVYNVEDDDSILPWIILMDGNGSNFKGFKSEWATVHNSELYVGSMGKEWTSSNGEYINNNPMWIKIINKFGQVTHVNWTENYIALRKAVNINYPGYMIHESCVWSRVHKRWFFLPRRSSEHQYNEENDEHMATNLLLIANDNFSNIKVINVGEKNPTHGFSSFKFVPGTNDEIILAIKSKELGSKTSTYMTAFRIDGTIILPEIKIADHKYEGIEFI